MQILGCYNGQRAYALYFGLGFKTKPWHCFSHTKQHDTKAFFNLNPFV
jgi:hypothetical protein